MAVIETRKRKDKNRIINVKVTEKERKAIIALAAKYTDGNVSSWLRYAAIHHKP